MSQDTSVTPVNTTTDHDLLIRVSTLVETLTTEIRTYNTSTITQLNDHEGRLRTVESEVQTTKGGVSALKWVIGALFGFSTVVSAVIAIFSFWVPK